MKPQKQLIQHCPDEGRLGDCQRTCIAVLLNMDAHEVPHFCDDPTAKKGEKNWWFTRQSEWLKSRGLTYVTVAYDGGCTFEQVMQWTSKQSPDAPMILLGSSNLGVNHVVVVLDGEIVCDPSGNGITGPCAEGTWEVSMISVGQNWGCKTAEIVK